MKNVIITIAAALTMASTAFSKEEVNVLNLKSSESVNETAAMGVDFKNVQKPDEQRNLRFQRLLVGQEKIEVATLMKVPKDSAWRRLGLQSGDIILHLAGEDIKSEGAFKKAIDQATESKSQKVEMKIIRKKEVILFNYQMSW